ncbi:MAG: glycosyltransferase family 4 protein [Planctomycetota bacterium]
MRILFVAHLFVPKHRAGVELYTAELARTLAARGHDIAVFHAEKEISRPHGTLLREDFEGHRRFRLINDLTFRSFEETYRWPAAERRFREALEEHRPEVVHFHHLLFLSSRLPELARRSGARVVMTLHDFWLACPRFGQMLEKGRRVCAGPEPDRCANCLADFKLAQTRAERLGISAIGQLRRWTGIDLSSRLEGRRKKAVRIASPAEVDDGATGRPDELAVITPEDIARRTASIAGDLRHVDVVLSPSKTVADVIESAGLVGQVAISRYGLDASRLGDERPERPRSPMRFVFIGTLAEHKGIHVLVDAFNRLPDLPLTVYGSDRYYPDYVAQCRAAVTSPSIDFAGELERSELVKALAEADALIVPSVWLENSPFTIQEAFLAGLPVLASDLGGMAELVAHETSGLLFEPGSGESLAEQAKRLANDPALYRKLQQGIPPIKSIEEDAIELEAWYSDAVKR